MRRSSWLQLGWLCFWLGWLIFMVATAYWIGLTHGEITSITPMTNSTAVIYNEEED